MAENSNWGSKQINPTVDPSLTKKKSLFLIYLSSQPWAKVVEAAALDPNFFSNFRSLFYFDDRLAKRVRSLIFALGPEKVRDGSCALSTRLAVPADKHGDTAPHDVKPRPLLLGQAAAPSHKRRALSWRRIAPWWEQHRVVATTGAFLRRTSRERWFERIGPLQWRIPRERWRWRALFG